ncbi:MAG: OmpA family protein [Bacteroidetes bacterium]|nr:OmpA family protein [Bacteroidota bacterium]
MEKYCKLMIFILLNCFFTFNVCSQENLIIDPSFEMYKQLPNNTGQGEMCLKYWTNAVPEKYNHFYIHGFFDYYHKKSISVKAGVPINKFGNLESHSGDAYAGICINSKYREFIFTRLSEPLKRNKLYCVSLFISKAANFKESIKSFGILFTSSVYDFNNKPQLEFLQPEGYNVENDWICLKITYKAKGDEKFIMFGCFESEKIDTHYYIDDVAVVMLNNDDVCECKEKEAENIEHIEKEDSEKPDISEFDTIGERHIVILKNINFEVNSAKLTPQSYKELEKLFNFLITRNTTQIEISGYTDDSGEEEKNKTLSEMRALSVANYLINNGIDKKRITSNGYGSENAIDDNKTDEGKSNNRRVEIKIIKD